MTTIGCANICSIIIIWAFTIKRITQWYIIRFDPWETHYKWLTLNESSLKYKYFTLYDDYNYSVTIKLDFDLPGWTYHGMAFDCIITTHAIHYVYFVPLPGIVDNCKKATVAVMQDTWTTIQLSTLTTKRVLCTFTCELNDLKFYPYHIILHAMRTYNIRY